MEKTWNSAEINGKTPFVMKEKLNIFKENIKTWNMNVFGILYFLSGIRCEDS